MLVALLNGFIGLVSGLLIGTLLLGLEPIDILICLLVSDLAALVALLSTLCAERSVILKKFWFRRSYQTWSILLILYFGILLAACPVLRNWKNFFGMLAPMIFATGFSIIVFGPIQDRIVGRIQKKAEAR